MAKWSAASAARPRTIILGSTPSIRCRPQLQCRHRVAILHRKPQTVACAVSVTYYNNVSGRTLIANTSRIFALFGSAIMPYEIKCDGNLGIIESTVTGVMSSDEIRSCTNDLTDLSVRHGVCAFLIDAFKLTSVSSAMDVYEIPGRYQEGGLSRSSRFALVLPELRAAHEIVTFYDNVCNNRGWSIQPFATRDEAIAWLTDDRPP